MPPTMAALVSVSPPSLITYLIDSSYIFYSGVLFVTFISSGLHIQSSGFLFDSLTVGAELALTVIKLV